MIARRGVCLVLAAPSGAGKTSVSRALIAREPGLAFSISATTRAMRPGEADGVDYHFRSADEFAAMEAAGELIESATVHGRRYGTPRAPVLASIAAGRDVMFDIDWQGHLLLRRALPEDVVGVFLLPPSIAELRRRLARRAQDSEAEIDRRLAGARAEIEHYADFDHVLVNHDFEQTVAEVQAILHAARARRVRQHGLPRFVETLLG